MKKVIIIGAGVGGLATAIRLAKKGYHVKIYEASNLVGGKCSQVNLDGFIFDTGPTLLTIPAVYRDLFMKSGKRLESILELKPVDPAFTYHFSDRKTLTFSNLSVKKNCDEIESVFGKSAGDAWHNLMQRAERMWDLSRGPFIESEIKIESLLKNFTLSNLVALSPQKSLRKFVSKYTDDSHLKMIIDRYATYSGSDPRKVPAPLLTIPFIESAFGAWHVSGGLGKLSEKLAERAKELGVEIFLGQRVVKIEIIDGCATGIKLESGEEIVADLIVANADAKYVYGSLISEQAPKLRRERRKLKKHSSSFSGFSLYLGLDNSKIVGEIPKLSHHNIWFPKDYDEEFKCLFEKKVPVNDPTIYICNPNDPEMIPGEGFEGWNVLINAPIHDPKNGFDWSNFEETYAELIIKKLDELGLRVSERLVKFQFRSPRGFADSFNAPGGAIYGTSSNGLRAAFMRVKNRSPIKNLYLVGGSTHPGGGLPLVGISSEIVANAID